MTLQAKHSTKHSDSSAVRPLPISAAMGKTYIHAQLILFAAGPSLLLAIERPPSNSYACIALQQHFKPHVAQRCQQSKSFAMHYNTGLQACLHCRVCKHLSSMQFECQELHNIIGARNRAAHNQAHKHAVRHPCTAPYIHWLMQ